MLKPNDLKMTLLRQFAPCGQRRLLSSSGNCALASDGIVCSSDDLYELHLPLLSPIAGREWIDFMNLGVDKGAGVAHLCEHLGIDIADAAAVGDTYNDIPMLERVGHSFIVDNAEEHMNAHAKWRIPSNNDGGVLTLIDAILAAR